MPVNPLRLDPTRTTTLRRKMGSVLSTRMRWLIVQIRAKLRNDPLFNPALHSLIFNTVEQEEAFDEWLQERIDAGILQVTRRQTDRFVQKGYEAGSKRAWRGARRRANLFSSGNQRAAAEQEFFRISTPDVDRLRALQGRTFRELEGVTEAMSKQIMRVLSDGLIRGDSTDVIADEMARTVRKIGINRARLIAETEIVRAHAEGALDTMERMGVTHVTVNAEWTTAGDGRVCKLCKPLDGVVLTVQQARGLFPRHPRCRCSPVPTKKPRSDADDVRDAIDASVMAEVPQKFKRRRKSPREQRKRSTWTGSRVK